MLRNVCLAILLAGCVSSSAQAGYLSIVAGNYANLPPEGMVQIAIMTSGDTPFQGVDLYLEIGGGVAGPMITAIDLIGPGTLFHDNNFGQSDFGDPLPSRTAVALASTQSGTVGPNGVLAIVTLDMTGICGLYTLSLTSQLYGPSDLPPFSVFEEPTLTLVDGLVGNLCPEPSSYVLGLLATASFAITVVRRRKWRARN